MNKRKRQKVFERDEWKCQYCGLLLCFETATIDHVVCRQAGGSNDMSNIRTACRYCNTAKGTKSIEYFRVSESVKKSKYAGICSADQISKLIEIGVSIEGLPRIVFHFEIAKQ